MKIQHILLLSGIALTLSACYTRIWTVAPTTEYVAPERTVYSTRVTTPSPRQTTTTRTVTVTSFNNDWSFYLDLQAVAAAFAESRNVQEFEQILNSSRYMINNLDLNRDGFIDYLRVLEIYQGNYHTFLIQACLAANVFQDVATLVAERMPDRLYVEVIGDPYLYGYNYIVRPTFVVRPPMWDAFGRPQYNPWSSPYYYGYWPNYYQQPKPVYLNHYQAYVNTYMTNHHYCHHCDYPEQPHYAGYSQMTQSHRRNDFATQYPDRSFSHRVTNTLRNSGSNVSVRNAGQLRTESQRQQQAQPTQQTSSRTTTTTTTNQSSRQTTTTSQSSRQTTTKPTTTQQSSRQPSSTSVSTRVNKSGTMHTTVKQTNAEGKTTTVKRTTTPSSTATQSSRTTTSGSSRR